MSFEVLCDRFLSDSKIEYYFVLQRIDTSKHVAKSISGILIPSEQDMNFFLVLSLISTPNFASLLVIKPCYNGKVDICYPCIT